MTVRDVTVWEVTVVWDVIMTAWDVIMTVWDVTMTVGMSP